MKERNRKILLTVLIGILLIVSATFLRIDKSPKKEKEEKMDKIENIDVKRVSEKGEVYVPENYRLVLEGENLNFYLVVEEEWLLLESAEITAELFPKEDIDVLKNGVFVDNLEDGIGIIEDFSS